MELSSIEIVALVLAALLAISEVLALIPVVKANSVFQLIVNSLKGLAGLLKKPAA